MYSDKIDPTLQGVKHGAFSNEMVHLIMQVYTLSIVFRMKRLEKLCIRYLEASVNLDNVLVSLKTASILFLQPIKEYCLRYITKGTLAHHSSLMDYLVHVRNGKKQTHSCILFGLKLSSMVLEVPGVPGFWKKGVKE